MGDAWMMVVADIIEEGVFRSLWCLAIGVELWEQSLRKSIRFFGKIFASLFDDTSGKIGASSSERGAVAVDRGSDQGVAASSSSSYTDSRNASARTPEEDDRSFAIQPSGIQRPDRGESGFHYTAEGLDDEQVDKIRNVGEKLMLKTHAELIEQLKMNKQIQTGRKEELVARVAECQVLGCLPACPLCSYGKLKWNKKIGEYHCPGSFYDEQYKRCTFRSTHAKRTPWVDA